MNMNYWLKKPLNGISMLFFCAKKKMMDSCKTCAIFIVSLIIKLKKNHV